MAPTPLRILLIATTISLMGCSSLTSPARKQDLEGGRGYWMDYDASRRGTLVVARVQKDGSTHLSACAEPAPDVAVNLAAKIEGEVAYSDLKAESKGDLALSAVKLAERTQMVLFFREALFRLCELASNLGMSSREAADLYVRVVETALRLGSDKAFDADILRLRAELARTEATITAAAALREQALAEKAKAHSDSEKAVLQKKVEELNTQIAKSAEEQKNLASQLAAASQLRQASAAADIARANSSRDASAEISQDPTKATPSATQR